MSTALPHPEIPRRPHARATTRAAVTAAAVVALVASGAVHAAAPPAVASSAPHTQATAASPAANAATPSPTDRQAARVAAGWLSRQFVDGDHLTTDFGGSSYDDPGLTLDAVLAFAAARTNADRSARALAWLGEPATLASYLGSSGEAYAGAHAKTTLALLVTGASPRHFGGRNVLADLIALQAPSGRVSDASRWGDYSNSFSQSLAVIALQRAGEAGRAGRAAAYLAGQACRDGSVPIAFDQARCTGDLDATAIAVQAFAAAGRTGRAAAAASWLRGQMRAGAITNANSAGLAASALTSAGGAGNANSAAAARRLVRSQQFGCAAPFARRGAVAFAERAYDAATARATTQGILGLAGADLSTLISRGAIAYAPTLAC